MRAATATPEQALANLEKERARLWRIDELNRGLARARRSAEMTTRRIGDLKVGIEKHEAHLAALLQRRDGYITELGTIPRDAPNPRRQDLLRAVAVLDGIIPDPRGTLADDLFNHPRIPQARRDVEDARATLAEWEAELARTRHGITIAEGKLRALGQ